VSTRHDQVLVATIIRLERKCRVHGTDVIFLASIHGEAELVAEAMKGEGWSEAAREQADGSYIMPEEGEAF